jgi:hypothetical protein
MPTTPISVSTGIQGQVNTTVYTVPAGRTAIVKSVSGQNVQSGSVSLTVSKNISGQNYVVVNNQSGYYTAATGATERFNENALTAPLTLGANEQLKVYTGTGNKYALPNVATGGTTADDGSNYGLFTNVFANGIYMVTGYYGGGAYVATSTDAITWTQRTAAAPFFSQLNLLSCNGSIWVATDNNNSQGTVIYSSDNGVTWALATFVGAARNVVSLINNGSTFLLSDNNGRIYSSTNGSTWTENTSFNTASLNAGQVYNLGWTGTDWVVGCQYGALTSSNLTTWSGYVGVNLSRQISDVQATSYSLAYNRYYTSRNTASVPNIFSSSNGYVWTTLSSSSFTPFKVNCAGANTVLIAVGSSGGTSVFRSTDGATFATATVVSSYGGPMIGLDNGVFLTMLNAGTNDACMLSTDPTVSVNTSRGATITPFTLNSAAADPVSGKWVGIGHNSTNIYAIGGTSSTNIGSAYNFGLATGAYGIPSSVCWSAVDGYFYMITDTGYVFRSQQYGSGWSIQATSVGVSNATSVIKAVGTTLYVVSSSQSNSVFTSSTLNGGASWQQYNYSSLPNGQAYRNVGSVGAGGSYYGTALATNGTDLVWNSTNGLSFALTPSISRNGMRMPYQRAIGTIQTVNSNQFMYGGVDNSTYGAMFGYFTSTNLTTTYGTYVTMSNQVGQIGVLPNRFNYIGGVYYLTNTLQDGQIYSGTSTINIPNNGAGTGSSFAGVSVVNPSNGWAIDGTNLVATQSNGKLNSVCKTTTPTNFLYAATVTASIVEIS